MHNDPWFQGHFLRNLVDMHIDDWDETFLSRFDPACYVELMTRAGVEAAMIYAQSHVGLCYYPTRAGQMHKNLKGRDIFGEIVEGCHARGIVPVAYYSLIFNNWAYAHYPEWRLIGLDGSEGMHPQTRYGNCCPNNPDYRAFAAAQLAEIAAGYPVAGFFLDMTFWTRPCYCPSCQGRYRGEANRELPRVIDWKNPVWVGFQRWREASLNDFAAQMTAAIRSVNPQATVTHQTSGMMINWKAGNTVDLATHSDFLEGDFYGGFAQQAVVCKLFEGLSPHRPYSYMSSVHGGLGDHTTPKSEALLRTQVAKALAHHGACLLIDAVDPSGTMDERVYEKIRRVFDEARPYLPWLVGEPRADVGVYFSSESKFDWSETGSAPALSWGDEQPWKLPHLDALVNVCRALSEDHIPYDIVSRKKLLDLVRFQVLVLPGVLVLSEEEMEALRAYVAGGGVLYLSGEASRITSEGRVLDDFGLAEVLGVSYEGQTSEEVTYIAPEPEWRGVLGEFSDRYPMCIPRSQIKVRPHAGVQVLARLALPYTNPADTTRFASIHSNPPGPVTEDPALTLNAYGQGRAVYSAVDWEALPAQRAVFTALIRRLAPRPFHFESDAPRPVEITLYEDVAGRRFLINLVNAQDEQPNLPARDFTVRVRLGARGFRRLLDIKNGQEVAFTREGEWIHIPVERLDILQVLELSYE